MEGRFLLQTKAHLYKYLSSYLRFLTNATIAAKRALLLLLLLFRVPAMAIDSSTHSRQIFNNPMNSIFCFAIDNAKRSMHKWECTTCKFYYAHTTLTTVIDN